MFELGIDVNTVQGPGDFGIPGEVGVAMAEQAQSSTEPLFVEGEFEDHGGAVLGAGNLDEDIPAGRPDLDGVGWGGGRKGGGRAHGINPHRVR